ncbi:M14 family metallopeptidase [Sphingomonas sp. BT-65]|uniref:M14 family metallopeptidase n=1 Tax=Sphingomonas sp. BT-65 TaxID=2989821 RepID=UPI00223592E4|nr:M14 family metallopeptidase [Sphingomonas sp. BT-65]MCW4460920.1 M14 family metallopeptidase [Sphingomonas sp. BT-65]
MLLENMFPESYQESRETFARKIAALNGRLDSFVLPNAVGAAGEPLAMDVARLGAAGGAKVLLITTATHGVEGFCGAGCLNLLLDDEHLRGQAARAGIDLLLVHGVNPYGFSHLRRVNEDNIDLNRNWVDFAAGVPENRVYEDLDPYLVPEAWPPTPAADARLDRIIDQMGFEQFRRAIAAGQYSSDSGLYFGGRRKSWSLETLSAALQHHLVEQSCVGWIDIHSGLGPPGHGEKMYVGRADPEEEARARRWWGQDVSSLHGNDAASGRVSGSLAQLIYDLAIPLQSTSIALEYGTIGSRGVRHALRGDQWLYRNPSAPPAQAYAIKKAIKDAFFCNDAVWKGMVLAQFRATALQAINGMATEEFSDVSLAGFR